MLEAITGRLRRDKKGVSNVIVAMLSLLLVVIVVSNVVLWSYQMNQLDWEKMQEKVAITDVERVTRSPWFTTETEYAVSCGSRLNGSYVDTATIDDKPEIFGEAQLDVLSVSSQRLDLVGDFPLDLTSYPLPYTHSIEIQLRYKTNDSLETWFLEAYNWTIGEYSDAGFNSTSGDIPNQDFGYYSVNLAVDWRSYVRNGLIQVRLSDAGGDANQTLIDIDFLAVRLVVDGTKFSFANTGPLTAHIVSIWVVNTSVHMRYEADLYINSAAEVECLRGDIQADVSVSIFKAVTERGNNAILSGN